MKKVGHWWHEEDLKRSKNIIPTQIFLGMNNVSKIFIDIWRRKKKKEKKPKRKQAIVRVDDLLVQKLITPITLEEYFPQEFFNRGMVT